MKKLPILKIFSSRMEAEIAKGFLESCGIKSQIFSDDVGKMYPSQQCVSGVRLVVDKKDLSRAIKLLEKNL